MSYGVYAEELTILLFLKTEHIRALPKEFAWPRLLARDKRHLNRVEELEPLVSVTCKK